MNGVIKLRVGEMAINTEGLVLQYIGNKSLKCIRVSPKECDWEVGEICNAYASDEQARTFNDYDWQKYLSFKDYLNQVEKL